jgi:dTDP-4-dehydrorhamnose reductase
MLGRDVVRACQVRGHRVIGLTRADLDITDGAWVDEVVSGSRPEVVVNCAAWTDVDGAEDHEPEATRVNSEAAGVAAAAAASVGAKVLYPSTDYVFDGRKRSPYLESDVTSPLSAYGRSKLSGETSVQVANERHFIVRSSWLYGVGGRNFVETMLALAEADQPEVLVVSDQVGCPTYTAHLAAAIAALIDGDAYGIHHVAGGGSCSWYEFAQEIFDQSGVECRVMAATTDMLERKAPRPAYSVLGTDRRDAPALPSWREGLAAYLAEREALEVSAS